MGANNKLAAHDTTPLSLDEGDALTRAYYSGLWEPHDSDPVVRALVDRGLVRLAHYKQRSDVRLGIITPKGRRLVRSGVPHKRFTVPLAHWSLNDQLSFVKQWLTRNQDECEDSEDDPFFDAPDIAGAISYVALSGWKPNWGNSFIPALAPPQPLIPDVMEECGSARLRSKSPAVLYRAMWLFRPTGLDLSDMYKADLFQIWSRDGRFMVSVEWFKYELCLYYYCDPSLARAAPQKAMGFRGGAPGSMNGDACSEPAGTRWFSTIRALLDKKYDVYAGNDFSV